ncbi:hypothetical protein SAMN05444272_4160 [Roseibium suaedae]|uniref:Uncharacterized protein n=1 Tax=Roseibium suaedae TaxID=735517 RepID=A0A1M7P766_9HYPH|nr:hypothetical protein SAMN05444272_4160 [Roseibium suaedae]
METGWPMPKHDGHTLAALSKDIRSRDSSETMHVIPKDRHIDILKFDFFYFPCV